MKYFSFLLEIDPSQSYNSLSLSYHNTEYIKSRQFNSVYVLTLILKKLVIYPCTSTIICEETISKFSTYSYKAVPLFTGGNAECDRCLITSCRYSNWWCCGTVPSKLDFILNDVLWVTSFKPPCELVGWCRHVLKLMFRIANNRWRRSGALGTYMSLTMI